MTSQVVNGVVKRPFTGMDVMWREASWFERISIISRFLRIGGFIVLPHLLFGLIFGKSYTKNSDVKEVMLSGSMTIESRVAAKMGVYQCFGLHAGVMAGTMTIIKLNGDQMTEKPDLLLYNVIEAQSHTVSQIRALGNVKVIIVPSSVHDSHAIFWSKEFPDAKLVCPKSTYSHLTCLFEPYCSIEDEKEMAMLLGSYWKLEYFNSNALRTDGDLWYSLTNTTVAPGAVQHKILLGDCGMISSTGYRTTWANRLQYLLSDGLVHSWSPTMRMNRVWYIRVVEDRPAYTKNLRQLAESGSWSLLATQHGDAIAVGLENSTIISSIIIDAINALEK